MFPTRRTPNYAGFALLEVVTASAIVATIAAGACVVLSMALQVTRQARVRTMATMVAAQKMEQLRSLAWTHITTGGPAISMSRSDVTTDLSVQPATDDGPGLLRSPIGTLAANIVGYVDYLDADGRWVGRGASAPGAAVFIRRWSVQPLAIDPDNILIFEVIVGERGRTGTITSDSVRLVSLEARK